MFLFFFMCLVDEQLKQHVGCGVEAKGNHGMLFLEEETKDFSEQTAEVED